MHTRLLEIIEYKTGGKHADFAELMGWSPQYLYKLLKGDGGIGIRPVTAILEKFPDLNARWLLTGEGAMVASGSEKVKQHLLRLLELEQYMPVMTAAELKELSDGKSDFDAETIDRWAYLMSEKTNLTNSRFTAAYEKQKELCKQNQVKK